MKQFRILILVIVLIIFGYLLYYFFIDTLKFSEITGDTKNPMANILVNLLDFDTGITRYEIYNLKNKSIKWEIETRRVLSIPDPNLRQREHEKLLAEMMRDPAFKKLSQKTLGFGSKGILNTLQIIQGFSFF